MDLDVLGKTFLSFLYLASPPEAAAALSRAMFRNARRQVSSPEKRGDEDEPTRTTAHSIFAPVSPNPNFLVEFSVPEAVRSDKST